MPRRHWLLLASDDLPQCFLYRVQQKRQQLEALCCDVRVVLRDALADQVWSEALLWADALIVCRLPATAPVLSGIAAARQAGIPSWYDLDDLVVDADHGIPPLASYGGTITPLQHRLLQLDVPLFAAAMRACDGAIVSTAPLADRWRQLNPGQPLLQLANLIPPALQAAQRSPRRNPRSFAWWWPAAPVPTNRSGSRAGPCCGNASGSSPAAAVGSARRAAVAAGVAAPR